MIDQPRAHASTHARHESSTGSTNRRPRRLVTSIATLTGLLAVAAASVVTAAPAVAAAGDEHLAGLNYVALGDSYTSGFGLEPVSNLPAE